MATARVFGPHVSGTSVLGVHIGATTEVMRDDAGGQPVPQSLSVVLSPPLGQSQTISSLTNGQSATVQITPGISVTGTIDDCHTTGGNGTPALLVFKFTLRASGSVRVGPFHVPLSAQVDAFDVHVPVDAAVHEQIASAHTTPG
ncbi:MAG TPA: hypothetical protein VGC96_14510 [Candidatus Elarobacter sp.]|jgi:hypothetical protein